MTEEIIHTHDEKPFTKKARTNPWMVSTIIIAIFAIILLAVSLMGFGITGNVVSEDVISQNVIDFGKSLGIGDVEVVEIKDSESFYEVTVSTEEGEGVLYVTKDGKFNIQPISSLEIDAQAPSPAPTQKQDTPQEITKSDKPTVELFVMTHCPYGTQAEKGFLPVMDLLEDVADLKIRFVHYFMHDPEETETPIQVCIREEQADKYEDYLACFLEDGDSDRCLEETDIDTDDLETCVEENADDYYAEDSALSEGYGVRGSPALVINGALVQSGRNPDAYLQTICSAFNDAPEECSESLSTENPSPGFGYGTSSGTTGSCG